MRVWKAANEPAPVVPGAVKVISPPEMEAEVKAAVNRIAAPSPICSQKSVRGCGPTTMPVASGDAVVPAASPLAPGTRIRSAVVADGIASTALVMVSGEALPRPEFRPRVRWG